MCAFTVDKDGKKTSFAEALVAILSDVTRKYGMKGAGKSAKREANAKVQERNYHVIDYGNLDEEANAYIHIKDCDFVATGFAVGPLNKMKKLKDGIKRRDGMADHYNFYACSQLGIGVVMSRRYPCGCPSCRSTLRLPWDRKVNDPIDQPRFQRAADCKLKEAVGDLNDWKVIRIAPPKEGTKANSITSRLSAST